MKAKSLSLMTVSLAAVFALVGCGDKHEKVHAVDKVEEAQAAALAKAPTAEAVKFDDHGQPTMGGVGGAEGANANTNVAAAQSDASASQAGATATDAAPSSQPETASATAVASGSDTKQ